MLALHFLGLLFQNLYASCSHDEQCIRAFDLGGGGLKTAIVAFKDNNFTIREQQQLGFCDGKQEYSAWLREKIPQLDKEICGGWRFGASYAGLDKLWEGKIQKESGTISKIFKIQDLKAVPDEEAHLIASMQTHSDRPILNIAIGTGVAMRMTNSKGEIRSAEEVKTLFDGKEFWESPVEEKAAYELFGGDFEGNLQGEREENKDQQVQRWDRFLGGDLMHRYQRMCWSFPKVVTFTGGAALLTGLSKAISDGAPFRIRDGPADAGILGAAIIAMSE